MEFCSALDMIGDYFMKEPQGYQFRRFCNINIVIHEYDIPSYISSGRKLLEEIKVKLDNDKEESQKASKI